MKPISSIFDIEEFLDPERNNKELQKLLDHCANKMDETKRMGVQILESCLNAHQTKIRHDQLPLILLCRHMLELLDAIENLLRNRMADPCIPLVRSLLEAFFSFQYLVESKNKAAERGLCFIYTTVTAGAKSRLILDPSHERGKDLLAKQKRDRFLKDYKFRELPESFFEQPDFSSDPGYKPIEAEWERRKKKMRKLPKWFSLFNEKTESIQQLADQVGAPLLYELIYRYAFRIHSRCKDSR